MIIDCFTFYNELGILKKRLKYLYNHVDHFVLVESTVTHRGEPKELYYEKNKDTFKEWNDKIIHIVVKDNPTDKDPWVRENYQRNCITRGLTNFKDDDLVMISDVDEIPHREALKLPDNINTITFNMISFQYSLDYIQVHEPWFGTILTTKENAVNVTPQKLRETRWHFSYLKNTGWHFSSFGDHKFAFNKNTHFAHCFDKTNKALTEDHFKYYMENGLHVDGITKLVKVTDDILNNVPEQLKN